MNARRRSLVAAATALALTTTATVPALGAFGAAEPAPLRRQPLIRVGDMAAGSIYSAVGYREGPSPGNLYVALSKDGGTSYRRGNGKLRRFPVAGVGKLGISLDICDKAVWAGSAANFPGDAPRDTDVLLTRRPVEGGQFQVFITSPSASRRVKSVDVACIGKDHLAVAWLERVKGTTRARLIIQDQSALGPSDFKKAFKLGKAVFSGGISVAATGDGVYVAWSRGEGKDLIYQRFNVGGGAEPEISRDPAIKLGVDDAIWPQLAARGQRVVIAYTDRGKVRARVSSNGGKSFKMFDKIIREGKKESPSRAWSIDISDDRVVVEASRNEAGKRTPLRIQSQDFGKTWSTTTFGHKGSRRGALQRVASNVSLLKESWHHNGANRDNLRAQFEKP